MILFQKKDKKFKNWQSALSSLGVQSDAFAKSPLLIPYLLLKMCFSAKPQVFVFRYLNDYPALIKSLLRLFTDCLTIFICKLFKIRIWWILHNIDKETDEYHPKLTQLRRRYLSKNSEILFVTDRILIPVAEQLYPNKKIDSISLGYLESNIYSLKGNDEKEREIESWLKSIKSKDTNQVIFVIGTEVEKAKHFKKIGQLIEQLNIIDQQNSWYALVIGSQVTSHPNILNFKENMSIPNSFITDYCDYYYRILDDYSVSYTLYEAAHYHIPIITENIGAIPLFVSNYKTGHIIEDDNYSRFVEQIRNDNTYLFKEFLLENNWINSAHTFKKQYYAK